MPTHLTLSLNLSLKIVKKTYFPQNFVRLTNQSVLHFHKNSMSPGSFMVRVLSVIFKRLVHCHEFSQYNISVAGHTWPFCF